MNPAVYDALARSPLVHEYADAFHRATGLALRLAPAGVTGKRITFGRQGNAFCDMVNHATGGCPACLKTQAELERRLGKKLAPQHIRCTAGLTDVAVPVLVGGQHVATLLGGQVFCRTPQTGDFERVARVLTGWGVTGSGLRRIETAYHSTPVVTDDQFRAMVRLLVLFAQNLGESANRWLLCQTRGEPVAVTRAKDFAQKHANRHLTLQAAAQHAGLSRYHFCRKFKKATGLTFLEYVCLGRFEKAKELIGNRSLAISQAAYGAGFQSIPHFNRTFKRLAGMTPTQYRASQRGRG